MPLPILRKRTSVNSHTSIVTKIFFVETNSVGEDKSHFYVGQTNQYIRVFQSKLLSFKTGAIDEIRFSFFQLYWPQFI